MTVRISSHGRAIEPQGVQVLVVGMARSGTTVAQRLVSEIEDVWVAPETHFWRHAAAMARNGEFPLDRSGATETLEWFVRQDGPRDLQIHVDDVVDALPERSYLWDLFTAFVSTLNPSSAGILGEKTPDHLRWGHLLMEAVEGLKIVVLVRDPRAVFRSHQDVPWGIRDVWQFAEKWSDLSRAAIDLQRGYPDRALVLRYEDLVADPEGFRSRAAHLIGANPFPGWVDEPTRQSDSLFTESEWWKAGALEAIEARPERWREEISSSDIRIIEWMCWAGMSCWDYPTIDGQRPEKILTTRGRSAERDLARRLRGEVLPLTADTTEQWHASTTYRAHQWEAKASDLAMERKRLRDWIEAERSAHAETKSRLDDWRSQARTLGQSNKELFAKAERLEAMSAALRRDFTASKEAVAARDQRITELASRLDEVLREAAKAQQLELRALRAERASRVARTDLQRLKARRWWRMGGAVSSWVKQPWRIDRLVSQIAGVAFRPAQLPTPQGITRIDERIEELTARPKPTSDTVAIARRLLAESDYDGALRTLAEATADERGTREHALASRDAHVKVGEASAALADVRRALFQAEDVALRLQERSMVGRIRELDTNWLPALPVDTAGHEYPVSTGCVLHIVKESLPFFERGYTLRTHSTLLAQSLAGYEPVCVTSLGFPRSAGEHDFEAVEVIDGIRHYRMDLGPSYDARAIPHDVLLSDQATLTAELAKDLEPALVQAGSGYRGFETALVGLAVARRRGIPMIYEMRSFLEQTWTADADRAESGEYYQRRMEQELRCLNDADAVVTIAETMRNEIIQRGIEPDRIVVIPNVVDVGRFQPRSKRSDLVDLYRLGDRFVLGYISNLGWREGIDVLLRALPYIGDSGLEIACLVVGEGPERQNLDRLITELGIEDLVVLTGHVSNEEIEDYYALIDLFVVPRIDERASRMVTPLKPLEAMSMEIPLLVADLPALRELAAPGERGMVFRPSDPEDLARAAVDLIAEDGLRSRLARNGREWVYEHRTLQSNAERYSDLLGRFI